MCSACMTNSPAGSNRAGEPASGTEVTGPAICELPEATLAVPPGWAGRVEDSGTIRLERAA